MLGYKGAGCLVFYYDKRSHRVYVLLGRRTSGIGAGQWSIPGGGWETKDGKGNLKRTAVRELREELKLRVRPDYKLVKVWSSRIPLFEYDVYAVRLAEKRPIFEWTEFSAVRWFDTARLPENLFGLVPDQIHSLLTLMKKRGYVL